MNRTLPNSDILMKDYAPHDARFAALCSDPTSTVAVLWPCESAVTPAELRAHADAHTGGRITLIAVDSTWNGARTLLASYPTDIRKVGVTFADIWPDDLTQTLPGCQTKSLLAPLRKYKANKAEHVDRCDPAVPSQLSGRIV